MLELAKKFVTNMLPQPGIAGVDLDSTAYREMMKEFTEEHELNGSDALDAEVRKLMDQIGSEGFGILSPDA